MNIYEGNTRNFHIVNLIFRYGGIAAILTGRPSDARKAKYQLQHTVRTHLGSNDEAYKYAIANSAFALCPVQE
jgi:3-ketoacyl-CoA synthase